MSAKNKMSEDRNNENAEILKGLATKITQNALANLIEKSGLAPEKVLDSYEVKQVVAEFLQSDTKKQWEMFVNFAMTGLINTLIAYVNDETFSAYTAQYSDDLRRFREKKNKK